MHTDCPLAKNLQIWTQNITTEDAKFESLVFPGKLCPGCLCSFMFCVQICSPAKILEIDRFLANRPALYLVPYLLLNFSIQRHFISIVAQPTVHSTNRGRRSKASERPSTQRCARARLASAQQRAVSRRLATCRVRRFSPCSRGVQECLETEGPGRVTTLSPLP